MSPFIHNLGIFLPRKLRRFAILLPVALVGWLILTQPVSISKMYESTVNLFVTFDASVHIIKLMKEAPTLWDQLLLIDKNILNNYNKLKSDKTRCLFCTVDRYQPITFALVTPANRSLEEHVMLPILRTWEVGFWVEQIVANKVPRFSYLRHNLPLGFILQKGGGALIIEIVLLHQREGDFWWHGSLDLDEGIDGKLKNLKIADGGALLALKEQGAYDKMLFESVSVDGLTVNIPRDVPYLLNTPTKFIECNYERAHRFHTTYGKDTSDKAELFRHRVRKLVGTAKASLDHLRVPFWLSSGTLLGHFRQCDVIPYTKDVDLGIKIDDYNPKIIPTLTSRGLKLKHKFGRLHDGFELSFLLRYVKLDLFFLYEERDFMWNGGHSIIYKNGKIDSGVKYRYKFPKFTLCWTEFLALKVLIPCETEEYVKANYGPDWFKPVSKWHWFKDPFNVYEAGVWAADEAADVLQVFP